MDYKPKEAREQFLARRADLKRVRSIFFERSAIDAKTDTKRKKEDRDKLRQVITEWYEFADLENCLSFDIPRLGFLKLVAEVEQNDARAAENERLIKQTKDRLPGATAEGAKLFAKLKEVLGDVT